MDVRVKLKNKSRKEEPLFTLQQNYIASLFHFSPNTVVKAIDKLCGVGVLKEISNKYGECSTYAFVPSKYQNLLKKAQKKDILLRTGRNKVCQNVSAEKVLSYIVGKSIVKASNMQ